MRILIIEDEPLAAIEIKHCILEIYPNFEIVKILNSVQEAIAFFSQNNNVDLIFSDIDLGDGLCFDIFKKVEIRVPVIFCTAYNNYAIDAFKANGIDYILKPFDCQSISNAIIKYLNLTQISPQKINELIKNFEKNNQKSKQILVHTKNKTIPISIQDIAIIQKEKSLLRLTTFDYLNYYIYNTLDDLEKEIGDLFFRANRQFLINRNAIKDAAQENSRKIIINLKINYNQEITVSKEKSKQFMVWLRANIG